MEKTLEGGLKAVVANNRAGQWPWWVGMAFLIGSLPAILFGDTVEQLSQLHALGVGSQPFFPFTHLGLIYFLTPLVVMSSFLLFLCPGAIVTLAVGQAKNVAEWVVFAFGYSLILSFLLSTVAKLVGGTPLTWPVFLAFWLGAGMVGYGFLMFQQKRRVPLPWPMPERSDGRRVMEMAAAVYLGVVALTPKIFWENFNADGIEAFEFGRSLTTHLFPHWEIHDGVFGFYHNFFLFAYPNHWFISLFGPVEAAVRLPFFLYLLVIFSALTLLIEWGMKRHLSKVEEGLIWLALASFAVVQIFNTTYEPFFADVAEGGATTTLGLVCFLCACYMLLTGKSLWFSIFALMTHMAFPGGLLLLVSLGIAICLSSIPDRFNKLKLVGGVVLGCIGIGVVYGKLYLPFILHGVRDQFSAFNLLKRLYHPTFTEFARWNALIFPCGVLPALSLLAVRRRNSVSWIIGCVTVLYFGVLYFQVYTNLHQLIPIMVLPLVVFWRLYLDSSTTWKNRLLPLVGMITAICLVLSLPQHFQVNQANRAFGMVTDFRIGDYRDSYEVALRGADAISPLLLKPGRFLYPEQPWGIDAELLVYYATGEKPEEISIDYVVQPSKDPAPLSFSRVGDRNGISLYVSDPEVLERDQNQNIPKVVVSPLYEPILRRQQNFYKSLFLKKRKKNHSMESRKVDD